MKNDLISRSALNKELTILAVNAPKTHVRAYAKCVSALELAPAVDAVEVVRCRDCQNAVKMKKQLCKGLHCREDAMECGKIGHVVLPEDYCSKGAKMDAEVE